MLFDARVTNKFFKTKQWDLENDEEREVFHLFNVTLRFIATHSGLTRWQETVADNGNDTTDVFAEYFSDAIEDAWYKKSVIWYEADPGSYVYSMRYPRDEIIEDDNDLLTQVTATRAIFLNDGEKATPTSVVGYRFPHSILLDLLNKITSDYYCGNEDSKKLCTNRQDILRNGEKLSNYTGENKLFSSLSSFPSCSSGEVRCFLLDGSGYILAMMSPENTTERTGQFFGKLEPEIMSQLVDIGLYVRRPLFDYQALCIHEFITSRASILLLPFYSIQWAFQWALGQLLWLLLKTNLHTILLPQWTHAAIDGYYDSYEDDPYYGTREEDDHEVLKDWRGRSIGKDDDYNPKKTVTVIKEACDKWAYRFSLTPPPPIPTTEMPSVTDVSTTDETTESMEISSTSVNDEQEEETIVSKHSEPSSSSSSSWTTQPTNSASVFYPFASVKSVVSRWKRSISTSSTPAPSDNEQLGENRSTTTESNEASTKMNDTDYVEPETSCPRPFTAERIPHSDLVLVVITNSDSYLLCAEGRKENEDLEMNEENGNANEKEEEEEEVIWNPSKLDMHVGLRAVPYNDTHACHKLRTDRLPRGKRTTKCITQHPKFMPCLGRAITLTSLQWLHKINVELYSGSDEFDSDFHEQLSGLRYLGIPPRVIANKQIDPGM
ncbi:hypothetical protein J437_LFUL011903 [Ladona fulva]|uniref:Voltage-dependent calcium channel alpha-2/delta subunit conserved region domain-containing protein n=1 Tax=Ladona fulva TaxID=123851 RepID=A0A8K0P1U5_LADFU|nr:hypothetical protein J437_LFUL011903 [Ladona fulva]